MVGSDTVDNASIGHWYLLAITRPKRTSTNQNPTRLHATNVGHGADVRLTAAAVSVSKYPVYSSILLRKTIVGIVQDTLREEQPAVPQGSSQRYPFIVSQSLPSIRPLCMSVWKATTVVISLRNSRQGDKTPPGPALQSSRPAERDTRNQGIPGSGSGRSASSLAGMVFSQVFVMAPIRSQDAELVFDVTQQTKTSGLSSASGRGGGGGGGGDGGSGRAGAPKRAGTCRVSLRELADQREHDLPLTVLKKASHVMRYVHVLSLGLISSGTGNK